MQYFGSYAQELPGAIYHLIMVIGKMYTGDSVGGEIRECGSVYLRF